jgi:hypothetical protein
MPYKDQCLYIDYTLIVSHGGVPKIIDVDGLKKSDASKLFHAVATPLNLWLNDFTG